MHRKRILYLCGARSFSAENLGRKLTGVPESWRTLGHEVLHVFGGDRRYHGTHGGIQNRKRTLRRAVDNLSLLDLLQPVKHSLSEWRDIRHNRLLLKDLSERIMVFRPDVIIERSARLITAGQVCAQQYGIPYVLEWLDHIVPYRLSLYQRRALSCERQKVANADFIIVVSNYLKKQMQEHGVDPRKIVIAHNAVDTEEFRKDAASRIEVRRKLGIADDEMLAGYLGSYAFYHDAKRLVLAADILRRYKCHKLRILMMGDGGNYNECYTLARKLGLTSSPQLVVKPRVPKEEVPGILSAMDVAVLPGSTDIICPIKVQEYMASELPTVLPDYPANREVIKHGETGLFFTPGNELSLADCLLSLGKDPIGSRKMGEKARVIVKSRFTWGSTWGRMLVEVLDGIEQSKTKVMN